MFHNGALFTNKSTDSLSTPKLLTLPNCQSRFGLGTLLVCWFTNNSNRKLTMLYTILLDTVIKGYHQCQFEVGDGEDFLVFKINRGSGIAVLCVIHVVMLGIWRRSCVIFCINTPLLVCRRKFPLFID